MTELIIAEEHSQLYELWQQRNERDLAVCHVDFHCDMRGLLIDRRAGKACFVNEHIPYVHRNDSGSFLSHAIMNGMVTKLRWVHDDFGGREYDYVHCVKYESDLSSLRHRLRRGKKWQPVDYAEHTFGEWGGVAPGEYLDIDWDGIAHAAYDADRIRRLKTELLKRDCAPRGIFLARSPGYSNPDRALFEAFVADLEEKFQVAALRLPPPLASQERGSRWWQLYHRVDRASFRLRHAVGLH